MTYNNQNLNKPNENLSSSTTGQPYASSEESSINMETKLAREKQVSTTPQPNVQPASIPVSQPSAPAITSISAEVPRAENISTTTPQPNVQPATRTLNPLVARALVGGLIGATLGTLAGVLAGKRTAQGVNHAVKGVGEAAKTVGGGLSQTAQGVGQGVKSIAEGVNYAAQGAVQDTAESVNYAAKGALEAVKTTAEYVKPAVTGVGNAVKGTSEAVTDAAKGVGNAVKGAAESVTDAAKGAAKSTSEAVTGAAQGVGNAVKGAAEDTKQSIAGTLDAAASDVQPSENLTVTIVTEQPIVNTPPLNTTSNYNPSVIGAGNAANSTALEVKPPENQSIELYQDSLVADKPSINADAFDLGEQVESQTSASMAPGEKKELDVDLILSGDTGMSGNRDEEDFRKGQGFEREIFGNSADI